LEVTVSVLAPIVAALMLAPLAGPEHDVRLVDALGFGVPRQVALDNARTADRHRATLDERMREWPWWVFAAWSKDMEYRREAWSALAAALDPARRPEWRAWSLVELRDAIGDEAYRAFRMPPPFPTYRR
jgi:hypothetical protein